ncbi:hypothetical protein GJ496_001975 [Pomphorhynchus laevis]|nr:hypothetical protein GJ496_001975 [Pomphorhynchus laevis]
MNRKKSKKSTSQNTLRKHLRAQRKLRKRFIKRTKKIGSEWYGRYAQFKRIEDAKVLGYKVNRWRPLNVHMKVRRDRALLLGNYFSNKANQICRLSMNDLETEYEASNDQNVKFAFVDVHIANKLKNLESITYSQQYQLQRNELINYFLDVYNRRCQYATNDIKQFANVLEHMLSNLKADSEKDQYALIQTLRRKGYAIKSKLKANHNRHERMLHKVIDQSKMNIENIVTELHPKKGKQQGGIDLSSSSNIISSSLQKTKESKRLRNQLVICEKYLTSLIPFKQLCTKLLCEYSKEMTEMENVNFTKKKGAASIGQKMIKTAEDCLNFVKNIQRKIEFLEHQGAFLEGTSQEGCIAISEELDCKLILTDDGGGRVSSEEILEDTQESYSNKTPPVLRNLELIIMSEIGKLKKENVMLKNSLDIQLNS